MKPKFGEDFEVDFLFKFKLKIAHANYRWSYFSPFTKPAQDEVFDD